MHILLLIQLTKMILILLVAVYACKKGIINQEGNRNISNLLLLIVNPILMVTVYQMEYREELIRGLVLSFVAAVIAHLVGMGVSRILCKRDGNERYSVDRFAAMYSNCAFMGIPIINSIFGSEGVFYLSAYMAAFNFISWTHGLALMTGNNSISNLKEGLKSPTFLATLLGIVMFFFQIEIPGLLRDTMDYIANMNTPLAMIVAGVSVAQTDFKSVLSSWKGILKICTIKLFIMPLLCIPLLLILPLTKDVAMTALIAAACPTATSTAMFTIRYGGDYRYASCIFALTTVLCIVTIPIVAYIGGMFF